MAPRREMKKDQARATCTASVGCRSSRRSLACRLMVMPRSCCSATRVRAGSTLGASDSKRCPAMTTTISVRSARTRGETASLWPPWRRALRLVAGINGNTQESAIVLARCELPCPVNGAVLVLTAEVLPPSHCALHLRNWRTMIAKDCLSQLETCTTHGMRALRPEQHYIFPP